MGEALAPVTGQGVAFNANAMGSSGLGQAGPSHPANVSNARRLGSTASSTPAGKPTAASKTYEFVLVTDSESRRQVRRHAMRQYMRQRRLDGIARLESTRVQVSGWAKGGSASEVTSASKIEELDDDSTRDGSSSSSRSSPDGDHCAQTDAAAACDSDDVLKSENQLMLDMIQEFGCSDPKATPSTGRRDPFNSYPLVLKEADHTLVHHFVTTYPLMMYKMGDAHQNNPIRGIFHRLALHDPVPFQAMLAIASKHLAGVKGQTDSVQSLTHKMRALRLLNERLKTDAGGKYDGTIYAAATMAVIEKWSKDASVERMHIQGITQMVRRRGGMRGLRATSRFLENILYWVDFSCAPKAIMGASLPWTGTVPDSLPPSLQFLSPDLHLAVPFLPSTEMDAKDVLDVMRACEDFLTFFRSLYELQQSLLSLQPPGSFTLAGVKIEPLCQRPNLFDESTPLYNILTTLPDYDHGIRDVRFIDEYTCLACLLYLNIALHDHYSTSRNFDSYLEWVSWELKQINPHSNPSISSVLWIFMNNGGFPGSETSDAGERSWFVSRMLRVAKKLEWKQHGASWDHLRTKLLDFLITQQECGIGSSQISNAQWYARKRRLSQPSHTLWDEDEMRRDILGALYAGTPVFTMPLEMKSSKYVYAPATATMV